MPGVDAVAIALEREHHVLRVERAAARGRVQEEGDLLAGQGRERDAERLRALAVHRSGRDDLRAGPSRLPASVLVAWDPGSIAPRVLVNEPKATAWISAATIEPFGA